MSNEQPEVDLSIPTLGPCTVESPLAAVVCGHEKTPKFVDDSERIARDDRFAIIGNCESIDDVGWLEVAGPRRTIFFDPAETGIGIVTCGGLCPGLNDVIRGLVMEAWHAYAVRRIYGFRYGFQGFVEKYGHEVLELTPDTVSEIHESGGSILASSRGPQDPADIVDRLERMRINILFVIGGDGSMRGALAISEEAARRGLALSVVGIPKTIDNDLQFLDRSFGFDTAYSVAVHAIRCAHTEATGTLNGVGLVKVMGRHSGFLACHAALATAHVNFCLIPENPFGRLAMDAFLLALRHRLETRGHAVVLVAEGTGQEALAAQQETDASGNVKLVDVGDHLAGRITAYLDETGMEYSLKYIDPSYIVRSVAANPSDSVYCWQLARNAVHAALAGKTEALVGSWHGRLVHIPIRAAIAARNVVDPSGELWLSVLETTGQPPVWDIDRVKALLEA